MTAWRVWSTYAHLGVDSEVHLLQARELAEGLIAAVDRTCSRFRTDSDLTRVNASAGQWVRVDPLLVSAVRIAVDAAIATDGLVDPCLGGVLTSWGYDVDLAVLRRRGPVPVMPVHATPGLWRDIAWDDHALKVPAGCALDLGATAKAWVADLVAETVSGALDCGVVCSLGGDVRVCSAEGWPVRVSELPDEERHQVVHLHDGGVATSTSLARRWRTSSGWVHHVIDPRSGHPAEGAIRTASTLGATCVAANAASTAALVLGAEAEAWLTARDVSARLVLADGGVRTVGAWPADRGAAA